MFAVVQRHVSMVLTVQKARGDSTVADLGQGYLTCRSLCNDTFPWSHRAAEARGDSTVAGLRQGC